MNKALEQKFTKNFANLLLDTTEENNLENALLKLFRWSYLENQFQDNSCYTNLSEQLVEALNYFGALKQCLKYELKVDEINPNNVCEYLRKNFNNNHVKPIIKERDEKINQLKEKIVEQVTEKYKEMYVKRMFVNNMTLRGIWLNKLYYIDKFNLPKPKNYFEETALENFIEETAKEYGVRNCDLKTKIELLDSIHGNRFKEIIEEYNKKYTREQISEELKINKNLLKDIIKYFGLKRPYIKKIKNLKETNNVHIKLKIKVIKLSIKIDNEKELEDFNDIIVDENITYKEGQRKACIHNKIERNPAAVQSAKEYFKKKHDGCLWCEVCKLDFSKEYGELGKDYIEAHHINPLAESEGDVFTTAKDFKMVCSNCHRMLHRHVPCLTVEKLKDIIEKQKEQKLNNTED